MRHRPPKPCALLHPAIPALPHPPLPCRSPPPWCSTPRSCVRWGCRRSQRPSASWRRCTAYTHRSGGRGSTGGGGGGAAGAGSAQAALTGVGRSPGGGGGLKKVKENRSRVCAPSPVVSTQPLLRATTWVRDCTDCSAFRNCARIPPTHVRGGRCPDHIGTTAVRYFRVE